MSTIHWIMLCTIVAIASFGVGFIVAFAGMVEDYEEEE